MAVEEDLGGTIGTLCMIVQSISTNILKMNHNIQGQVSIFINSRVYHHFIHSGLLNERGIHALPICNYHKGWLLGLGQSHLSRTSCREVMAHHHHELLTPQEYFHKEHH